MLCSLSLFSGRVPTYSLHSAYEKFVVLPSSGPAERTKAVVPKCFGRMPPPHESLFAGRLRSLADAGLSSGRRFRVGWAGNWVFANPGCPTQQQPFAREHLGYVNIEQVSFSSGNCFSTFFRNCCTNLLVFLISKFQFNYFDKF